MDFLGVEPINITESYIALLSLEKKVSVRMKWIRFIKLLLNKRLHLVSRAACRKSIQYKEKYNMIKINLQRTPFNIWKNKTKWRQLYHKITAKTRLACFTKISELLQKRKQLHEEKIRELKSKATLEKQNSIKKTVVLQELTEKKTLEKFHKRWNRQKGRVLFSVREKWNSFATRYVRIHTRTIMKQQRDELIKRNFWINSAYSILYNNYIKTIESDAIHYHTYLIWRSFTQRLKTRHLIKTKHSKSPGMSTWTSIIQRYIRISNRKALLAAEKHLRLQNSWKYLVDQYVDNIRNALLNSERRRIALEKDREIDKNVCDKWFSKWVFEYQRRTLSDNLLKSTFEDSLSIYKTSTQNNAAFIIQSNFRFWNDRRKKRERFFTLLDTMAKWKSALMFKRLMKIKPPKVIAEYDMPRIKPRLRLPMLAKHAASISGIKGISKTLNAMIAASKHRATNESVSKVIISAASTPIKPSKKPTPPSSRSEVDDVPSVKSLPVQEITSEPEKAQIERRCSEANLSKYHEKNEEDELYNTSEKSEEESSNKSRSEPIVKHESIPTDSSEEEELSDKKLPEEIEELSDILSEEESKEAIPEEKEEPSDILSEKESLDEILDEKEELSDKLSEKVSRPEEIQEEEEDLSDIVSEIISAIDIGSVFKLIPPPAINILIPQNDEDHKKSESIESGPSSNIESVHSSSNIEGGHSSEIASKVVDNFALEDIIPAIVAPSINVSISPVSSPMKELQYYEDEIVAAINFDSIIESVSKVSAKPLYTINDKVTVNTAKAESSSSESGDPFMSTKSQDINDLPSGMEISMPTDPSLEEEEDANNSKHNDEEEEKSLSFNAAEKIVDEKESSQSKVEEEKSEESISFDSADGWAEEVEEKSNKENEKEDSVNFSEADDWIEEAKEPEVVEEQKDKSEEEDEKEAESKSEDVVFGDIVITGNDFTFINEIVDVGNYLPLVSITPISTINRRPSLSPDRKSTDTEIESDDDFGMSDVLDEVELPLDIAAVIEPVYNFEQSASLIVDEESNIDISFSSSDLINELNNNYHPMIRCPLEHFESLDADIKIDPEVVDGIIQGIGLFSDVPGILKKMAPQFSFI